MSYPYTYYFNLDIYPICHRFYFLSVELVVDQRELVLSL